MFVIPKKDAKVVDPQLMDAIPPEGRDVGDQHSTFWSRRFADGDITIVPDDQVATAKDNLARAEAARHEAAEVARKEAEEKAAAEAAKKAQAPKPSESPKPQK